MGQGTQAEKLVAPAVGEKNPAGQGEQVALEEAPTAALYVPTEQGVGSAKGE